MVAHILVCGRLKSVGMKISAGKYVTGAAHAVVLLSLAACATQPSVPKVRRLAELTAPVGLETRGNQGRVEYVDVRGAYIEAPSDKLLQRGKLWLLGLDATSGDRRWVDMDAVKKWSAAKAGSLQVNVALRDGMNVFINRAVLAWCPADVKPEGANENCFNVKRLSGATVNIPVSYQLSSTSQEILEYGLAGHGNEVVATFNAEEAVRKKQTLEKSYAQYKADEEARRRMAAEQSKKDEQARLNAIRSAAKGTRDNCVSTMLVRSSEPVGPGVMFKCAVAGRATLQELQNAGWDVQITGRVLERGMVGTGDSIHLAAVKMR